MTRNQAYRKYLLSEGYNNYKTSGSISFEDWCAQKGLLSESFDRVARANMAGIRAKEHREGEMQLRTDKLVDAGAAIKEVDNVCTMLLEFVRDPEVCQNVVNHANFTHLIRLADKIKLVEFLAKESIYKDEWDGTEPE